MRPSLLAALSLLACSLAFAPGAIARNTDASTAIPSIAANELPKEGQETLALILRGGPFTYSRDGIVFGNYEKRLPKKSRGYYLEYTVKTPHERTRGARRIICGGKIPSAPEACYYTADHYETFSKIALPAPAKDVQ